MSSMFAQRFGRIFFVVSLTISAISFTALPQVNATVQKTSHMKSSTKIIKQQPTNVFLEKADDAWEMKVVITKANDTPSIRYDEFSLTGVDDRGKKIHIRKMDKNAKIFIEVNSLGATATGFFVLDVEKTRLPVSVEVSRGGERHSFVMGKIEPALD